MMKNFELDITSIANCLVAMSPIGDAQQNPALIYMPSQVTFVLSYILKCSNQQV